MTSGQLTNFSDLGTSFKNFFNNFSQTFANKATETFIESPENKKIREHVHAHVDNIRMLAVTSLVIDLAVTFFLFFLTSMTGGLFGALLTLGVLVAGGAGALLSYDTMQVCDKVKDLTGNAHHFAKLNFSIRTEYQEGFINECKSLLEKAITDTLLLKLVYTHVEKWVWAHIKTQAGIQS